MLLLLVKERVWHSLSLAHRDAISKAAGNAERELWDGLLVGDEEVYAFARAKGMKVVELSSFDLAEWRACSCAGRGELHGDLGPLGQELHRRCTISGGQLTCPCS